MKKFLQQSALLIILVMVVSCTVENDKKKPAQHVDKPFIQAFSIKYVFEDPYTKLINIVTDRNGYIQILSTKGLLRLRNGQFVFPGTLVKDVQDRQTSDKKIAGLSIYNDQLVYIDDKAIFSNAEAGKLYSRHTMQAAKIFAGGKDYSFLISDGMSLNLIKDSECFWKGSLPGELIRGIKFDENNNLFWILGKESVSCFSPEKKELEKVITDKCLSCFELSADNVIVGTSDGYYKINRNTRKQVGNVFRRMPSTDLTAIKVVNGDLWFGSIHGAMHLKSDGKFDYYSSERWIPSDTVVDIAMGPENSVLILTTKGLGKICFENMTLFDKANYYEKQVRERHIRTGFNSTVTAMVNGDITSGSMEDSDNDGLWTSMYLAGETFRYAVTKSQDALQNVRESLNAMERLYTITRLPGFPARSFERRGYKYDSEPWRRADDPEWDWKSTTSSDEAIGHIFAFGVIAELVDEPSLRNKAIELIDTLMSNIIKNDLYLIDWDGKPTRWGRWNPEYVNSLQVMVGDRKINSSNIIGMLQTAYYFTHKDKYKEAAFNLMNKHGYLKNLMRPMKEIGVAPADADKVSRDLSDGWNHSDDEMYYCGYWGLYRYAFNDTLKGKYKAAILDHWEAERPEKEGLWNIMTAMVEPKEFDLAEAVWYLQRYPLDLINWTVTNSHRKDIEIKSPNFRRQTTSEVLPPDELGISRHNANRFDLDDRGGGVAEYSAGDIWLLPYWIGRYLGVISKPDEVNN